MKRHSPELLHFMKKRAAALAAPALAAIKIGTLRVMPLFMLAPCAAQTLPALSARDVAVLAGTCVTCHGPGGQQRH